MFYIVGWSSYLSRQRGQEKGVHLCFCSGLHWNLELASVGTWNVLQEMKCCLNIPLTNTIYCHLRYDLGP